MKVHKKTYWIPLLKLTGRVPGKAASNSDTCVLVGPPNLFSAPENSLLSVFIWAWISSPTTLFHGLDLQYCKYCLDAKKHLMGLTSCTSTRYIDVGSL